jgi:hypothetical protein
LELTMLIHKKNMAAVAWALFAGAWWASLSLAQAGPSASNATRVPVLVELFTSEGCSDCPPADRLLEELDTKQSVPGAQAIVLSEHVTYWNHQGWTDPFSLTDIDERQKDYGDRFRIDSIYTPQVVVDGAAQMVGNDAAAVTRAVANAAQSAKKPLTIADAHWDSGAAMFTVHGVSDSGARLIAVLAEDATQSQVARGENAGHTLHHVAVLRSIKDFGSNGSDGKPFRLSGGSLSHRKSDSAPARLIVFLVDRKTGHVTGVAEQAMSR